MTPRTILAVGAHIGDMDLAAGPVLAQNVLDGGRSVLLALTPGERGHPRMSIDDYRQQKIDEAHSFAAGIGAEIIVYDDISDGFLTADDDVAARLARDIRAIRPELLLSHWPRSIHRDHEQASLAADRARFLAGLPGWEESDTAEGSRHGVGRVLRTENWEDAEGFSATAYVAIEDEARRRWREAIAGQAFARGETYGFRYIDYYDAQLTTRGALARVPAAVALADAEPRVEAL
ncbi:PIG-L deacetylase family protein [Pseudactinotalea sp.]|uniref:PIG-L deacetylase family protein n=1 Tax=Pseudactinotalea sp. TaxID=1926260 RepID=UPI003B3AB16E